MGKLKYILIMVLVILLTCSFAPKKHWGVNPFGFAKWGASSSGGSGTTYWDTAMSDRWDTPMTALWNTSMNTEIP